MSEEEMEVTPTEEVETTEENTTVMNETEALKKVLKNALIFDGLRRGLHECARILHRKEALLCVLSEECDNDEYKTLVKTLCEEGNIPLICLPSGEDIAKWCGICKTDADGNVKKAPKCSVAVIEDPGEKSSEWDYLMTYIHNQKEE